jgi:NitT/TauT family transport system ATP-binding protein
MVELKLKNVSKKYKVKGRTVEVLDNINLTVRKRESISLVGPSGCGKTVLIRLIAGLETPTKGKITVQGKPVNGPTRKVMMVFQSAALLPWKTVLENVELALLDKDKKTRREIAMRFIDLVGLDGFEESFPSELSSGMRQRVGLTRAICREPDILLMDEPFSGLDPLTANNLRTELIRLFKSRNVKQDVFINVTHNIEEAVFMSDRVIVLSKRPAKIVGNIKIELPKPADLRSKEFFDYVDQITALIT